MIADTHGNVWDIMHTYVFYFFHHKTVQCRRQWPGLGIKCKYLTKHVYLFGVLWSVVIARVRVCFTRKIDFILISKPTGTVLYKTKNCQHRLGLGRKIHNCHRSSNIAGVNRITVNSNYDVTCDIDGDTTRNFGRVGARVVVCARSERVWNRLRAFASGVQTQTFTVHGKLWKSTRPRTA